MAKSAAVAFDSRSRQSADESDRPYFEDVNLSPVPVPYFTVYHKLTAAGGMFLQRAATQTDAKAVHLQPVMLLQTRASNSIKAKFSLI